MFKKKKLTSAMCVSRKPKRAHHAQVTSLEKNFLIIPLNATK